MKKIISILIIGFIFCSAFIKPKVLITDYRDAYAGNYFCHRIVGKIRADLTGDTLTIGISKDVTDSILQIDFKNYILKVKLLGGGILQAYPTKSDRYGGKFFAADSITFDYTPGKAYWTKYVGKKK